MSSIFSTQNRQSFLRRKYCFLVAIALSPPVGRMDPLIGRPPLCSAILALLLRYGRSRRGCCRYRGGGRRVSRFSGHGRGRHHLLFGSGHRRSGGHRSRLAMGTLLAGFLPLLKALHLLVNTDGDELHHGIGDAQTALNFMNGGSNGGELDQDVVAFGPLLNLVGELTNAPLLFLVDGSAGIGDG